jgi:hypothetical protein
MSVFMNVKMNDFFDFAAWRGPPPPRQIGFSNVPLPLLGGQDPPLWQCARPPLLWDGWLYL